MDAPIPNPNTSDVTSTGTTNPETSPNIITGFNGQGWAAASKADKVIWNMYSLIHKLTDGKETINKKISENVRSDIFISNLLMQTLQGYGRKFAQGEFNNLDTEDTVAAVIQAIASSLTGFSVYNQVESSQMLKSIQEFHKDNQSILHYATEQKNIIEKEVDLEKVYEAHKAVLEASIKEIQDKHDAVSAIVNDLDKKNAALIASNEKKLSDIQKQLTQSTAEHAKALADIDAQIKQINGSDTNSVEKKHSLETNRLDLATKFQFDEKQLSNQVAQLNKVNSDLHTEINAGLSKVTTLNDEKNTLSVELKKDELRNGKFEASTNYGKYADVAGSILWISVLSMGIHQTVKKDDPAAAEKISASGLQMMDEVSSLASAALDIIKDNKKAAAAAKGAGVLGALSNFTASVLSIKTTADQLNNPNLTPEQRKFLQAEVGLQGVATGLSAFQGSLTVANSFLQVGTTAANVIGKTIPVLGTLGSILTAINPAQWADFDNKQDRLNALDKSTDTSADLLKEVLGSNLKIEKGFYGATTALDMMTGIASGALASSGIGAGIAMIVGLIGGAISAIIRAFQQGALERSVDAVAEKMLYDAQGAAQTIQQYFDKSFDHSEKLIQQRYEKYFDNLLLSTNTKSVIGFSGVGLTNNDLSLAAITKTGGELNKTAKNYFLEYKGKGNWIDNSISLTEQAKTTDINLPDQGVNQDGSGKDVYLTFLSPLFANAKESIGRESAGKNKYKTTLTLTDIKGWSVIDQGKNNTTFDAGDQYSNLILNDENKVFEKFQLTIKAGDGDDTYFSTLADVDFDGGSGTNVASYVKLNDQLSDGIAVGYNSSKNELYVIKNSLAGNDTLYQHKSSVTEVVGNREDTVEHLKFDIAHPNESFKYTDDLSNVQIIQATNLNDVFMLDSNPYIEQIQSFEGDDFISAGVNSYYVAAGDGNDTINLDPSITNLLQGGPLPKNDVNGIIYLDGGQGTDTLNIQSSLIMDTMAKQYVEKEIAKQRLDEVSAKVFSDLGIDPKDAQLAQFSDILKQNLPDNTLNKFHKVIMSGIETVQFELNSSANKPQDPKSSDWSAFYKTAQLANKYSGNGLVDNTFFASDYEKIADLAFPQDNNVYPFKTKNTSVDWYDAKTQNISADFLNGKANLAQWFNEHSSDWSGNMPESLSDVIPFSGDYQQVVNNYLNNKDKDKLTETIFHGFLMNPYTEWGRNSASSTNQSDKEYPKIVDTNSSMRNGSYVSPEVDHLLRFKGQIYLEKGQTYTFKDEGVGRAMLSIDGKSVLDNKSNATDKKVVTTANYQADKAGYVNYEYVTFNPAKNNTNAHSLSLKTDQMPDFVQLKGSTSLGVSIGTNYESRDTSMLLVGGTQATGFNTGAGNDIALGTANSDNFIDYGGINVFSGGGGNDNFAFKGLFNSSFSFVTETSKDNWRNHTYDINMDVETLKYYRHDSDLVITSGLNENIASGLTLRHYFDVGGDKLNQTLNAQFIRHVGLDSYIRVSIGEEVKLDSTLEINALDVSSEFGQKYLAVFNSQGVQNSLSLIESSVGKDAEFIGDAMVSASKHGQTFFGSVA